MKNTIVSIWNDFENYKWNRLVESMPQQFKKYLKPNGDFRVRLNRIYSILHFYKVFIPLELY